MFTKSAKYYDLIYKTMKDYGKESGQIKALIDRLCPDAKTVLDVACGPAEHNKYLKDYYKIDGIDINEEFIEIAREKNPECNYVIGNMMDFDLGKKYDVVMCLFSSIAYCLTLEDVKKTLVCFRKHLKNNGIIIVEPFITPDVWKTGLVHMATVSESDLKICRMNISERKGNLVSFTFNYLIGTSEGVEHILEPHKAAIYTVDEMKEAFKGAGLEVEHDPKGIFGRGLYTAKKRN